MRWGLTFRQGFGLVTVQTYAVLLIIYAVFLVGRLDWPQSWPILVISLAFPVPILILLWMRWAAVIDAVSTLKWAPAPQVLQELERVLREEGIPFTKVTPDGKRGFYDVRWEEVYELDGGLRLNVLVIKRMTRIFLGPVGKDNRDEVERLKRLVERALE